MGATVKSIVMLTALVLLTACQRDDHEESHSLMNIIRDGQEGAGNDISSLSYLTDVDYDLARGFDDRPEFFVAGRTSGMEEFPCSQCHTESLARMGNSDEEDAHWEQVVEHAPSDVMDCLTCHSPGDMDSLKTIGGTLISMDRSYEICSQCHSTEAGDWAGGAHGKRLGGWAPPRVVETCAACHDPHAPAWQTRWPARAGNSGDQR
jgi:hypothetical protein